MESSLVRGAAPGASPSTETVALLGFYVGSPSHRFGEVLLFWDRTIRVCLVLDLDAQRNKEPGEAP